MLCDVIYYFFAWWVVFEKFYKVFGCCSTLSFRLNLLLCVFCSQTKIIVKILSLIHTTCFGTMVAASGDISVVLLWTVLKAMCSTLILTAATKYSYSRFGRFCDIKSIFLMRKILFHLATYWVWIFTVTVVFVKHVVMYW